MKKNLEKTVFQCTACKHKSEKWQAKCPSCGSWNTLQAPTKDTVTPEQKKKEDRSMFLFMVIIPLGLLGVVWMWTSHGFAYGLLTGLLYAVGYLLFFKKK